MCNKIRNNLIRLLKHKNHPNILLYNVTNTKLLYETLQNVYTIDKNIIEKKKDITYIYNNIYYEFNMNNIRYKNKIEWLDILKDIIETRDYYTNHKKIIILNNFQNINISIQNILKVIIEKNHHVSFIIVCEKITNLLEAIKSRFVMIRIPNNMYYQKFKSIENIDINKFVKNKYQSIDYLKYLKDIDDTDMLINKSIEWLLLQFNMTEIHIIKILKEFSYLLISINYPINIFLKKLMIVLLDDYRIIHKTKTEIINFISDSEYKYNNSYYKMIHIEYILLNIYKMIKT